MSIFLANAYTTDTSAPTLTTARRRITTGKKKHDSEASDSGAKKDARPNRVPHPVDMARVLHANWVAY
jgi:hypothetical protein